MKQDKTKTIIIFFLVAIIVVLSWTNFKYYNMASDNTNSSAPVNDASKEALIAEIKELRTQLQASEKNNESKVNNDVSIFISAYYDNDDSKITAADHKNNLKPLMTEHGYGEIDIHSDDDGTAQNNIYKYSAQTAIEDIYYKALSDTRAKVLAICDLTVTTVSGINHSMILLEVECDYDEAADRWLVDEINYNNVLNLNLDDFRRSR